MKKMIHRLFALALVCMLFASMALSVSATELDPVSDLMPIELENGPEAGYVTSARAAGLPFTMYAKNVTSFLSTQASGKCFVPSDYMTLGSTVWAEGNFTQSRGLSMKAGVCYYSPSAGKYLPAGSADCRASGCPYRVQPFGSCTGFHDHEHLRPRPERE